MYGYIYKRENLVNKKIYVGQHKYDKFEIDPKYRGSGNLFRLAMNKYGEENFTYELLDSADTEEELNLKEQYWIANCGSLHPNGYNLNSGGANYSMSDYTKLKLSHSTKGLWKNSEYRNRMRVAMSVAHIGKSSGMAGKRFTEDELERFRTNSMGRKWFNNGEVTVFAYECPEGFIEGRLPNKGFASNAGNVWITKDGKSISVPKDKLEEYLKDGYVEGRVTNYKHSPETIEQFKKTRLGKNNPMYGKKYKPIHKGNIRKRVPEELVQQFLDDGWEYGFGKKQYTM